MTKEMAIDILRGGVLGTDEQTHEAVFMAIKALKEQERVDAEPVKHGQWKRTDAYPHKVYCSECYATLVPNDEWLELYKLSSNYCPNCGAKMDEAKDGKI